MTPPDVSDAAVEAAMLAENKFYAEKNYTSFESIGKNDAADAMRAAIAAAVPHLLEVVTWQHRYRLTDSDAWTDWARHNGLEYMDTTKHHYTRRGMQYEAQILYRLRTQENAE